MPGGEGSRGQPRLELVGLALLSLSRLQLLSSLTEGRVRHRPVTNPRDQGHQQEDRAEAPEPMRARVDPQMTPAEHQDEDANNHNHISNRHQGHPTVLNAGRHWPRSQSTMPPQTITAGP